MKTVLITGGAGFIGQSLAKSLVAKGHHVRILDNFSPQIHSGDSLASDLSEQVDLVKADIRDRDAVRSALKGVQCLMHLAAETGTGQSMYDIDRYFSVNVEGTARLLDVLQNDAPDNSLESIIVASSRAIYGEGAYHCDGHGIVFPDPRNQRDMSNRLFDPLCPICKGAITVVPTPEAAPFGPMSFYGLTKQVQEQAALLFARTHAINCFALRYQNVYGPGQSLQNPYTGILAVFSNLARQNSSIDVYEDGRESRDFVYIDDVVEATVRCVEYRGQFTGSINVGSGRGTSVMSVAEKINAFFGGNSQISVNGNFRIGDIRHNIADRSLLKKLLDFEPQTDFDQGLSNFLRWAVNQDPQHEDGYSRSVDELLTHGLMVLGRE